MSDSRPPTIPEADLIDPWLERGDFLVRMRGDRTLDSLREEMERFAATHKPPLQVEVTTFDERYARVKTVG